MATVKVHEDTTRVMSGRPPRNPGHKITYDTKGRISGDKPGKAPSTVVHHANRKASVTPIARTSRSGVQARAKAGIRGMGGDENRKTPRRLNLGKFAFNPKAPSGYQHVLMGEMVMAFVIIGIRAVADYTPASDYRSPGAEKPTKGASPISLIAATLAVYFVLAFLATRGGWPARIASAFGLLMILGLMINSEAELSQVAQWVEAIGPGNGNQVFPSGGGSSSTPAAPPPGSPVPTPQPGPSPTPPRSNPAPNPNPSPVPSPAP